MNKINDSTRRGTMLVPLSTVHKCIVSGNIMIPGTRAHSNVPLQWNYLTNWNRMQ